ncbi:MAG: carboxymuconolactone decarboxylase family protein [Chloroflexi bacterium]|nr:carboxymuconolactone decarboxylase family protein [Chloroflexota bacterium]
MVQVYSQRLFDVPTFAPILEDAIVSFGDFVTAQRRGTISKAFQERLMLAVTHVNGCRYCSYFHTKVSLREGMSGEEIAELLRGEFGSVPPEEAVAVLFAEHYAESAGQYDTSAYQRVLSAYGEEKTAGIVAAIRMIMIGNIVGLMFDVLLSRLNGRPVPGSTLAQEIGVAFGGVVLVPAILLRRAWMTRGHG